MKKLILLLSFFALSFNAFNNPIIGADTIRIDGKLVLVLLVDGYGAGYEYGRLLGEPIADVMENYVINHTFGGATNYQYARQIFDQKFIYDAKYEQIAQGMLDGMEDAGVSIYSPTLGENLTFKDVLIANSIPDFTAFGKFNIQGPGCSDLMSWGDATANSELGGELVISRNLDWESNPYLINNALIIIWGNLSGEGQRIITLGFTGLIGALSGINESGVATFQNMGNYNYAPIGTDFYPVNLAQRDGLESWDYNNDGVCSPRDVSDAVRAHNVSSTFIINSAASSGNEPPAEVLEIHNSFGDTIRTIAQNPDYFGDNLVSTNHFRLLKPPSTCYRYSRIADSLETNNQLDIQRNWQLLQAAGVSTNLQTIQYIPYQQKLRFSFAEIGTPAYQIEPTEVSLDTLFSYVGIDEMANSSSNLVQIFPNPCQDHAQIQIKASVHGTALCKIFDLTGKTIFKKEVTLNKGKITEIGWGTSEVYSGIYFCHLEIFNLEKQKLGSDTRKIIVSK